MQTFNPMLQYTTVKSLVDNIAQLKREYDRAVWQCDETFVYMPKGIKLTHKNRKVEFCKGELYGR